MKARLTSNQVKLEVIIILSWTHLVSAALGEWNSFYTFDHRQSSHGIFQDSSHHVKYPSRGGTSLCVLDVSMNAYWTGAFWIRAFGKVYLMNKFVGQIRNFGIHWPKWLWGILFGNFHTFFLVSELALYEIVHYSTLNNSEWIAYIYLTDHSYSP